MTSRTPRIAVVLAVYNGAKYITEAIRSVLAQTFRDFELVVIDDGSTDRTAQILKNFRDTRLRVIRFAENQGLVAALNTGIRESQSELIARMDADDICVPQRFERQVAFLDAHPEVALCGTWSRQFGDASCVLRPPTEPKQIRARLFFGSATDHPSIMMRRAVLERHGLAYDDEFRHVEDLDFFMRFADVGDLANVPEVLLHTRAHGEEISVVYRREQVQMEAPLFLRQLRLLMPDATVADAVFHIRFATGALDESRLGEAERWLSRLDQANRQSARYDQAAFQLEIAWKWYNLSLQAISARPGALLLYWKSRWATVEIFRDHPASLARLFDPRRIASAVILWIRRLIGRAYDEAVLVYERLTNGVRLETIDPTAFALAIPNIRRAHVSGSIPELLRPTDNVGFFADAGRCEGRHKALPKAISILPDLFPPNIAVLDFLYKYIKKPGNETILDYGCGIGVLIVYLRKLGFVAFGYDDWSQIAKSTAEAFLSTHEEEDCLLGTEGLKRHDFTILSCVGIHWSSLSEIGRVLKKPSLKYILVDRHYRPESILGFNQIAEYRGLLTVYQRAREQSSMRSPVEVLLGSGLACSSSKVRDPA